MHNHHRLQELSSNYDQRECEINNLGQFIVALQQTLNKSSPNAGVV